MKTLEQELNLYRVGEIRKLENDGVIGIPVELTYYFDTKNKAVAGFTSTPLIVYIVGAKTERVGTKSDVEIVRSMIERGYIVAVLDYLGQEAAKSSALDFSVQKLRNMIANSECFEEGSPFPKGLYSNSFVVPSGHDVSLSHVYFELDKHAADGSLEKIVEVWNHDFRGVKGDRLVKWTHEGKRKAVAPSFDGAAPEWFDSDGTPNADGEYTKVQYTVAKDIFDCVKPDGTPIDLKLYMHLIFPTAPKKSVPVMCLASSSEHLAKGTCMADRPHLLGFSFRGYAVAMYDYGYVPMARCDHYGYFDGYPMKGYVTGDNWTYSIQFFNDKRTDSAAMRYLRYLSYTNKDFSLDTNRFGVFGNSKGGCMTYLGEAHPEQMWQRRMFPNHHGETRFENGDTKSVKWINGGEEQPWLTYNGTPIPSTAQLIYASCGGGADCITAGHAPMFISCNRKDGTYFGSSNMMVNACRIANVPALWFEIDKGHSLATGPDMNYGVDTYEAFMDFANYFLKGSALKVMYSDAKHGKITVKFSGEVSPLEIRKACLTADGETVIKAEYSSRFGDTEWTISPVDRTSAAQYVLTIPADLMGKNGVPLGTEYQNRFDTLGEPQAIHEKGRTEASVREIPLSDIKEGERAYLSIGKTPDGEEAIQIDGVRMMDKYKFNDLYHAPFAAWTCNTLIEDRPLTKDDIGRTFRISMRIFDTKSRYIVVSLNGCTSKEHGTADYQRCQYNVVTKANEWCDFSFDYTVYEPSFGEVGLQRKALSVSITSEAAAHTPIWFKDLKVVEFK